MRQRAYLSYFLRFVKIGIVTNLYPPYARGGAEFVIVRTVEQLLALGHDVFVITGQPKSQGRDILLGRLSLERVYRFFPNNIYFTLDDHKYPWMIRLFWHIIDAFSWSGAEAVRTIVRDERPDVVITHNLKGIGLRIPSAIQKLGIPHIHVLHDLQLIVPSGLRMFGQEQESGIAKIAYGMYRAICRKRMGKPRLVVSPSTYLRDEYVKNGFFKEIDAKVRPNPAPKFISVVRDGRSGGPVKFLYAGQLGEHKGVKFLLDAFAKLPFDARLLIAGDGPMRAFVEERARADKRIMYLGYTQPEELAKCMEAVDALVVPSLCYENSPTVIYETLMAGVPLIASRIGGVGELIQEGKNGYLFTPGDSDDFVRVATEMHNRKEEFAKNRQAIRTTIEPYALHNYADWLLGEIARITGKPAVTMLEHHTEMPTRVGP
ncbi:MAG: Glycosyltransferase [Candidatus Uhrbacteria bacterium GW2011_GWD2_52_7]|uniref:Glycosyltransferase n=1 Tax=Candidatus Uhrbacteria bacterium GW2011_GWD2_52_7 TaxID=1618989 RepID=A0A0G1XEF9_9BACT|nr:MAG: Glycosyltransferase [Candidatus Uhrbacteria bacterium GW2011_GWD2_52_7]